MKRSFILLLLFVTLGGGLGACTSMMGTTSAISSVGSISSPAAMQLDTDITPKSETNRLIEILNKIKINHHRDALDEIKSR